MKKGNERTRTFRRILVTLFFLIAVTIAGVLCYNGALETDFSRKNMAPSPTWLFGTDWLGRNMLMRTLTGLSMSIIIGVAAAAISAVIAFLLGIMAATLGSKVDAVISGLIDMVMGIPHILLLILISFAMGKGIKGVVVGVALSHWPSLARVIRAEVLQLKESQYIKIAEKLGQSKFQIAMKHMVPHLAPQFIVGLILLFPHAILHEASITFLGFGLSSEQPAIGIILSESMKYLITGKWWLAVFPGIMLVLTVVLFDRLGNSLRRMLDPSSAHE